MILSILLFLSCGNEQVAEHEAKINSMDKRISALEESAQKEQLKKNEEESQDPKVKCASIISKIKKLRTSWEKCIAYETEYAWESGADRAEKRRIAKTCGKESKPLYKEGKELGCSLKGILVGKFFDGGPKDVVMDMYYYVK